MQHSYGMLDILNKEIANIRNEQKRHCRIGKVTKKPSPLALLLSPPTEEFYEAMRRPVPIHDFQRHFLVG